MTYKKPSGFTLVELLIVIGIITILSAIMAPNIVRLREVYVVKGEMQRIIAFLNSAKGAAMKYNDQISMIFPATTTGARIEMFVDANRNRVKDSGEAVIQYLQLDSNLKITNTSAVAIGVPPTGVIVGANNIRFQYNNNPVYRRVIIATYGRIRVERSNDGTTWY